MATITENLQRINERIELACNVAGRRRDSVELIAVSKRQPRERLVEAVEAGLRVFGESRVQETRERRELFPADATIHFIGHLQRNKAREAVMLYDSIDSIDAVRTVQAVSSRLREHDEAAVLPVLVEVNTSGEESKNGVRGFDQLCEVTESVLSCANVRLTGLMTIGPLTRNEAVIRHAFADLRELLERLSSRYRECTLSQLSMGMSNDYYEAILEGATTVRVGTALFGERSYG